MPLVDHALGGERGPHQVELDAVNRRGRGIGVRVVGSPLMGVDGAGTGVILMMEPEPAVPAASPLS